MHASYDRDYANRFWRVLAASQRGVRAIPHRLPRQGEPGAFLLGQLRSRGDALFRPQRAAPSRRRAEPARRRRAGGLFARSVERGLLAGRRARSTIRRYYSYAYPAPEGFRDGAGAAGGRRSSHKELGEFILPYDAVRTAADPRRGADGFPAIDLRRGRRSRQMGPRGAGMRAGRAGQGEGGVAPRASPSRLAGNVSCAGRLEGHARTHPQIHAVPPLVPESQHWLNRARQCRLIAGRMRQDFAREHMLKAADAFERNAAESREREIARRHPPDRHADAGPASRAPYSFG